MMTTLKPLAKSWLFRSLLLLPLMLGLGLAPAAQAAAPAIDNSAAAITVYAPGAPLGSPVEVQYNDGSGNWIAVSGWTGTLDRVTDNLLVPYKQFTVYKANFGQGPFRWVVFNLDGKTVWGTSDTFNLPPGGGINQTETIMPGLTGTTTAPMTATAATTTTAPAATATPSAPMISAGTTPTLTVTGDSIFGLVCGGGCDHSSISAYFTGLPDTTWFEVQWGDGLGNWTTVPGWVGMATTIDSPTGSLFQQWAVFPANYGQGPFRWAAFDRQGGTLLGVSDNFNLPSTGGQNHILVLSK